MRITQAENISNYQAYFADLYKNERKDFAYIFGYLTRHIGYLCKSLNSDAECVDEYIKAVSWIFALSNKLGVELEKSLIGRHPGACPYCVVKPCKCITTGKRPALLKMRGPGVKSIIYGWEIPEVLAEYSAPILSGDDLSLQGHADRLDEIYSGNVYVWISLGAWKHTSKMQEELAEIHEAVSRYFSERKALDSVGHEIADLTAWLLSSWKLRYPNKNFDAALKEYFMGGCPICHLKTNCDCKLYSDQSSHLVEPEKFEELRNVLQKLSDILDADAGEIASAIKSVTAAKQSANEPIARAAISEASSFIDKVEKGIDRSSKSAKGVATLVDAAKNIIDTLTNIGS